MISLETLKLFEPLQKLPKNLGDLGKLIAAKGFKRLPNLVTLVGTYICNHFWWKFSNYSVEAIF